MNAIELTELADWLESYAAPDKTKMREAARQLRRMAEVESKSDTVLEEQRKWCSAKHADEPLPYHMNYNLVELRTELVKRDNQLSTYNQKIRDWWSACSMVMENYSFITAGSREPVTTTMKRPENDEKVFRLVVSLNNLRKQFSDMEAFMRERGIPMERPK